MESPQPILRIAVLGPESTGKSWLCDRLAKHYNTLCINEYAREYLHGLERSYTNEDIRTIYESQFTQEQQALSKANQFLFTDTEFIIGKVWSEHVFKADTSWFDEMIERHPYDLYLLTFPDLPWEFDPLRENPGKGEFFFNWYQRILEEHQLPYGVVRGVGEERLHTAIAVIQRHCNASEL